ncbi:MAG TPA: hypothetical protein VD861_20005 [Pyrinomonadaceae bacterium]|nr:hypothetical protein [Pyrinomonadaceae bacterium]
MREKVSRRALSICSILVLLAAAVVSRAAASTAPSIRFHIPFDFVIAGKTLPAGDYVVERSTLTSAQGLSIRGVDKDAGVYVLTAEVESAEGPEDSKLVFNRYGDRYFLSEFWTAGRASGRRLIKSGEERALLAREAARGAAQPQRVAVVSSQK